MVGNCYEYVLADMSISCDHVMRFNLLSFCSIDHLLEQNPYCTFCAHKCGLFTLDVCQFFEEKRVCHSKKTFDLFFTPCRARWRLWRSSKRLVVRQLFSWCKKTVKCKKPMFSEAKLKQTAKQTEPKKKRRYPETEWKQFTLSEHWNSQIFALLASCLGNPRRNTFS